MFGRKRRRIKIKKVNPKIRKIQKRITLHASVGLPKKKKNGASNKKIYFPSWRVIKKAAVILFFISFVLPGGKLVAESAYLFFTEEIFDIRKIKVENNIFFRTEEIVDLSKIKEGKNIFDIKIFDIKDNIEKNRNVDKVIVTRMIPDTIQIKVYEKNPKMIVVSEEKEYFVGQDGTFLSWEKERMVEYVLPKVEGFKVVGGEIKRADSPELLSAVITILENYNEFRNITDKYMLNKIQVINKHTIKLIFDEEKIIVLSKEDDLFFKFSRLEKVLEDLEKKNREFKKIDLRFNDIVVI